MWNSAEPIARKTYRAHLKMYLLAAPSMAMIQYAPFLAVKTFNAAAWVPVLAALIPASHLLAIFFTRAITRSRKSDWVVRPMIISNLLFLLMFFVDRSHGWMFAMVIILAQSLRAPIISAQSAIFRTNYPSESRSYAMAIPMAIQFIAVAAYSRWSGTLFDHSEDYILPVFLAAGLFGVLGAWIFNGVPAKEALSPSPLPEDIGNDRAHPRGFGLAEQFAVLFRNPGFFRYQLAYLFFGSGFVAISATLPLYLAEEFDASHMQATMAINTIPMLTTAITLPFWGRLIDRFNPLLMRAIINGIWSLTPLLLYFAVSVKGVYAAQLIQGLVWSGSTLIWWLGVNYFAREHEVAGFMSIHQTLTGLRGIVTPFIGIEIAHRFGFRTSMLFWFVLMLVGFFIMLREVIVEWRLGRLTSFAATEVRLEADHRARESSRRKLD